MLYTRCVGLYIDVEPVTPAEGGLTLTDKRIGKTTNSIVRHVV